MPAAATVTPNVDDFDLRRLPADFHLNPYPYYRGLRETAPVKLLPDGSYLLSRYCEVDIVYRDTKTFSSDKKVEFKPKFGDSLLYQHHTTSLVFNDPPLHTRVRRLIAGALTPRAIAAMEPGLHRLVEDLLDRMAKKGDADIIEDFAAAIPIEVIGNLLGIPRDRREPLREWSLAILGALEPAITPEAFDWGNRSVRDFLAFLDILVEDRRKTPGDLDNDVLTRLIQGEAGGEKLSNAELLQNCIFLLNAGHETTTNLIGNALHSLANWPAERRRLVTDPSLMRTAVDEFLRFESPNQLGNRRTTTTVRLGGVQMPAGTSITIGIGAANRDPEQFTDPERLDVGRSPNRHLAFASGPHQCVGLHVARLEGRIAIGRFLARFPGYELRDGIKRGGRARFRGFLSVPARLH